MSVNSWIKLKERSDLVPVCRGWYKSFMYIDPFDPEVQTAAMNRVVTNSLQAYGFVPDQKESVFDAQYYDALPVTDSDSDNDELDVMVRRVEPTRRSARVANKQNTLAYYRYFNSNHIILDGDDDATASIAGTIATNDDDEKEIEPEEPESDQDGLSINELDE